MSGYFKFWIILILHRMIITDGCRYIHSRFFVVFVATSIEGGSNLEFYGISAVGLLLMFFGARMAGSLKDLK